MKNKLYVFLYLFAIVAANLSIGYFGANVAVVNAFLFIGLDLTARDGLHEAWNKNHLLPKMLVLVLSGSVLSWWLNHEVLQVAIASFVAFSCAGLVDTAAYHLLRHESRMKRVNGSNVAAAIVDSVLFPVLAFGGFPLFIIVGQFVAKVLGGLIWAFIILEKQTKA